MKNVLFLTVFLVSVGYQVGHAGKYSELIKEFYAAVDAGNFDKASSYLSPDLKVYMPFSSEPYNKESYRQLGMGFKQGFPDMQHVILEATESKGVCAFKAWLSGTNTGQLQGNPPTRNHVELPFIGYIRFNSDKKFEEVSVQFDVAAFNAQLMQGVVAGPNKAGELANRFFNDIVDGQHKWEILNDILASEFTSSAFPVPNATREQFIGGIKALLAGYPDIRSTIVSQHFQGNKVISHGYWEGTNTGSFMGIPATGKKVRVEYMDIWIENGGKLVRNEVVMDIAGLQAQLGDPQAKVKERNITTVKNIYAAFAKKDIPAILMLLSDEIVWTDGGTAVSNLHTGIRRGKPAVRNFFETLNKTIEVVDFKVFDYTATANKVIATGHYKGIAIATKKPVSTDFAMIWDFDEEGKVLKHHIYIDSDNVSKALAGINNHIATARMAYEDFLAVNVTGILSILSDQIVWNHGGDPGKVPFAGSYRGKEGVGRFLQIVGSQVEIMTFEPFDFAQSGNVVTNKIHIVGKVVSTGVIYEHTISIKWTFDNHGKALQWDATGDMRMPENAFAGNEK